MTEEIARGLRQRGIYPEQWNISPAESPLPGTTRIIGQRETVGNENGYEVVHCDLWTLIIRDGVPQWKGLRPTRQTITLPTPCGLSMSEGLK